MEQPPAQQLPQSDPALEEFGRLRLKRVEAEYQHNASAFLAEFQSTAASLQPDEGIKLELTYLHENTKSLKAVLSDPQANKICSLQWDYSGEEAINSIIPLLNNNCPELASLKVDFEYHSAFDFVSSLLEHPSNKIKVLEMPPNTEGDSARFFAALGQSQVSVLTLSIGDSPEFAQGLFEYLAKDLLVRLKVMMHCKQVPPEMLVPLAKCTRLAQLKWVWCLFSQSTAFPKSITKLELENCTFAGGLDWSFLAGSNVRELDLYNVNGVDGNQLGSVLADYLRAKGLAELRLVFCDFVDETLAVIGVDIGRIKRLMLEDDRVNDASVELIALTLQSPNNEMKELVLDYAASSIETHLVPALKHPNCNLAELLLLAYDEHKEAAKKVEDMFHNRRALFALLQGQQVRRRSPCPLRRLPVEMLRLVGMVLL
ncbi:hypothetical protein BASA81_004500 [Batrachochytrium salamandrivorans]|nr:hypothetical protein BASA81_004500 [Batrachochytrium salamandrivorans]